MKPVWRFLKSVPKYLLVLVVIAASTVLFAWWWMFYTPAKRRMADVRAEEKKVEIARTVASVEKRLEHLVLIEHELFDEETGELYFKNWLKEAPLAVYLEADKKSLLVQYPNGFARHGLDGTEMGQLLHRYRLPFGKSLDWATFCKDGDVWRAEVDWRELKFVNERQVTRVGQFPDRSFAENVFFGTDKMLVVRVGSNLVKVDFASGEVKPVRYPLDNIVKRRSPEGRYLVGIQNGKFWCHDVESGETQQAGEFKSGISDYQWLGEEKCVFISGGVKAMLYNRLANSVEELAALPVRGDKVDAPSPDGRYLLTTGRQGICVLDVEKKKASLIRGGMGIGWIAEGTLLFTRDVVDSNMRGTWIQKAGEDERRVFEQPYLTGRTGANVLILREADAVLFATSQGVIRMRTDGTGARELMKTAKRITKMQAVMPWQKN